MAKPIEKFIKKVCVQNAIYWSEPTPDGSGGYTFDIPEDIMVRWGQTEAVIPTATGEQYVCVAEVMVTADVDKGGYLYLGMISDLDIDEVDDPRSLTNAHKIMKFEKVPMIFKTDEFVRKAYL